MWAFQTNFEKGMFYYSTPYPSNWDPIKNSEVGLGNEIKKVQIKQAQNLCIGA